MDFFGLACLIVTRLDFVSKSPFQMLLLLSLRSQLQRKEEALAPVRCSLVVLLFD